MRTDSLLFDGGQFFFVNLEVHGDSGRLDGDTALLFVIAGVSESHFTGLGAGDDTGF